MSKSEQPNEPEESPHQRDKTAKEPKVSVDTEIKPKLLSLKSLLKQPISRKNTERGISESLPLNPLIFFVRPLLTFKRNSPLSLLKTLTSLSMIKPRWKIILAGSLKNIARAQPSFLGEIWIGSTKA